jgi:hypothetical protein
MIDNSIVSNKDKYPHLGKQVLPHYYIKKYNPTILFNYRPIALANTIYKVFISILTTILSIYGEKYQILYDKRI